MNNIPLEDGETITSVFRLHPIALVPPVFISAAFAIGAAVAMWLGIALVPQIGMTFVLLGTALVGLSLLTLLIGYLTYRRCRLILTNVHVFVQWQSTLFSQTLTTIALATVTDSFGARSGILATIFNFGEVTVQTKGGHVDFITFKPVGAPEFVAVAINDAHEDFVRANPLQSV